ncbi:MAG: copper amine oxidase N-terminal domain-containing protein, partial [Tissierellia bacterium]|nr:copper amine oxidase N-terminal domain-containing protein [Tissierellia bacterium]
MKRKSFIILLALIMVLAIVPKTSMADDDLSIWVDGKYVTSDTRPFIEDGRTLVPVRFVAESLGYKVSWDEKNSAVIIDNGIDKIIMVIGSINADHNGKSTRLNKAPKLQNSRTFVPVRDVAERFGKDVDWDDKNWTVVIGKGYKSPASVPVPGKNGRISVEKAIE